MRAFALARGQVGYGEVLYALGLMAVSCTLFEP